MKKRNLRKKNAPAKLQDFVLEFKDEHAHKEKVRVQNKIHHHTIFAAPKKQTKALITKLGIPDMRAENYLESPLDRNDLVVVKPINLLKAKRGVGLFATAVIPAGTCIGEYTGESFSKKEYSQYLEQKPDADTGYALNVAANVIDSVKKGNFTRYINHSETQANIQFVKGNVQGRTVVRVVTTSEIKPGTQILLDYNDYDESAAKEYYFLNPGDGSEATHEIYEANKNHYTIDKIRRALPLFDINIGDKLCVPKFVQVILRHQVLKDNIDVTLVNFPCITIDNDLFNEFDERDTISPLMLACYLGQINNAEWLISHGANVDQQQNRSGMTPLLCALRGYQQASSNTKHFYITLILKLVAAGANIKACDRDEKSIIHIAASLLSAEHFYELIKLTKTKQPDHFTELYNYVDNNNQDMLMICMSEKRFQHLAILLREFPDYMEYFVDGETDNIRSFKRAIKDYTQKDKNELLEVLNGLGNKPDQHTLSLLGLVTHKKRHV